jgi:RNase P subunit RPR2
MVQKNILDGEAQWTAKLPAYAWESVDPLLTEISYKAFRESESREKAMIEQMKKIKKTASILSSWLWKRMADRSGVPLV